MPSRFGDREEPDDLGERAENVTFSFGHNWQKFIDDMPDGAIDRMAAYVADWLGPNLSGSRLVDVGSGQGLTSFCAFQAGAEVVSFDIDPLSVAATQRLWTAAGRPQSWTVRQGSVLDSNLLAELGTFDVVICWGVLHHTGRLWEALDAAAGLVRHGGVLWIALYHRTPQSGRSLRTKHFYNRLPRRAKVAFRSLYAAAKVAKKIVVRRRLSPLHDDHGERGMDWRRDIEDWLGGLPYEVSSPGEVLAKLSPQAFTLERLHDAIGEGGNDVYLFRRG
jgi:2-polyprenyl-6-hydroxyphenyl methylase/3-demethylubiquinone-9 3-methyltransferase